MTAENQIHSSSSGAAQNNRIMRQQQLKLVSAGACQREWQVLKSDHRVVHARQPESCAVILETHALIDEHGNSFGAEEISDQSRIGPVVMIAQDCVDAVSRAQGAQQFRAGCGVGTFLGNVVAGERNDVGLQTIGCLHCPFDLFATRERAVMNIGKLNYAKPVEFTRQSPQMDLMMFYRQPERLGQRRTRCLT